MACPLLFMLYECLIHASPCFPGSWHDSRLANEYGSVPVCLADENKPIRCVALCNTALTLEARVRKGRIFGAQKAEGDKPRECGELATTAHAVQSLITEKRNSASWGAGALKGPPGRLLLPLKRDNVLRARFLRIFLPDSNLRTR